MARRDRTLRLPLDVKEKGYFISLRHSFCSHLLLPSHSHLSFSLPPVGSREGQPDSQGICPSRGHPCGGLGCPEPTSGLDKRLLISAALPGARGSCAPAASPLSTNTNTHTALQSCLAPGWQGHGHVQDVSNSEESVQSSYSFGTLRCDIKHCSVCRPKPPAAAAAQGQKTRLAVICFYILIKKP